MADGRRLKTNQTWRTTHTRILLYSLTYTHSHSPAKAAWLLLERDGEGFALHCNTTNKRSNQKTTATDRSLLYCFCTLVILAVVVVGVLCYFCWFLLTFRAQRWEIVWILYFCFEFFYCVSCCYSFPFLAHSHTLIGINTDTHTLPFTDGGFRWNWL